MLFQKDINTYSKSTIISFIYSSLKNKKLTLIGNKYFIYILLPQYRYQHLFKNIYVIYTLFPKKKTSDLIQKYLHINCSVKKTSLLKLFFLNLLYQNFPNQNHQKKFQGHEQYV